MLANTAARRHVTLHYEKSFSSLSTNIILGPWHLAEEAAGTGNNMMVGAYSLRLQHTGYRYGASAAELDIRCEKALLKTGLRVHSE